MYADVRQEARGGDDRDQDQQDRCRAPTVSHGPRSGERQKPGRNGPGGAGGMVRSPLGASERYERAARERAGLADREPRPRRATSADAVDADPRPAEPLRHDARRLQPDPDALRGRARRVDLDDDRAAVGASSSPARRSSRIGAPPMPMLPSSSRIVRQVPARGTCDHSEPLIASAPRPRASSHRDRGEIDAEPALAGGAQRGQVAPGPAAEVEHGRLDVGEDLLVDRVGGREPAVERQRLEPRRRRAGAARVGAGRPREQVLRGRGSRRAVEQVRRGGAAAARRRPAARRRGGARCDVRRAVERGQPRVVDAVMPRPRAQRSAAREARAGRLGGDRERVVEGVDVQQRRRGSRGCRPSSAICARWTAPVRALLIGTPANTAGSGVRRPMPQ